MGKVRQREIWRKEDEENRDKVKIVRKTASIQELKAQVAALLREDGPHDIDTVAQKLHLEIMGRIRLKKILHDLEAETPLRERSG
jgi:hypothetical protein